MARMNFFDILSSTGFDASAEYRKLNHLFAAEHSVPIHSYLKPLKEYANQTYFRKLPFRGTYTDIDEMISRLERATYDSPLDRLLVFCEFLIAVLPEVYTRDNSWAYSQSYTIMQNITAILEQTGYELHTLSDSKVIIVQKNPQTTQAVELVEDETVARNLLEYNHFTLKGDLDGKREILVGLGRYLEPILLSRKLEKNGYKQLDSDMGFLLNKFHIRHNNKEGKYSQEYIQKISEDELEEWYDKTYNTALAVIIADQQIDISAELGELKRTYTWKS